MEISVFNTLCNYDPKIMLNKYSNELHIEIYDDIIFLYNKNIKIFFSRICLPNSSSYLYHGWCHDKSYLPRSKYLYYNDDYIITTFYFNRYTREKELTSLNIIKGFNVEYSNIYKATELILINISLKMYVSENYIADNINSIKKFNSCSLYKLVTFI